MKSRFIIFIEGTLYFLIPALTPVSTFLASDIPMTHRAVAGVAVAGFVAGCTSLKAFFSTAMQSGGELLTAKVIKGQTLEAVTSE